MQTLFALTLSGSAMALLLLALRYMFLRRMPSTVYYYAWLLVLLRFVLPLPGLVPTGAAAVESAPAAVTHALPRERMEWERPGFADTGFVPAGNAAPAEVAETEKTRTEAESASPASPARKSFDWKSPTLWLAVWGIGTALSLAGYVLSYELFAIRVRRAMSPAEVFDRRAYAALPGRKPVLCRCAACKTPLMFGVLHPIITLPERAYDEELLTNILRHELTHYRRRDPLYKWFAVAVLSTQWFNPLSYLIRREINRACELSCDEMLLRSMSRAEKRSYGNTLLNMAASGALPAGVVATTFATEKRNLKERLEQIMTYQKSGARVLAAVLALVLLAGCGVAAGPAATAVPSPAGTDSPEAADGVIRVSTVDGFLAAIRSNVTIELEAGEYDLSTASDYGEQIEGKSYTWNPVFAGDSQGTGAELVISGVEDLTIRGAGMDSTTIAAVPRYANVIRLKGCAGVSLENLTAGHTREPGFCSGGVLRIDDCGDINIDRCGLYGCGTVGVQAENTSNLSVTACDIYECSLMAVEVNECRRVRVEDCDVHDLGRREGEGAAISLFNARYTEGFTVYKCRIYDSNTNFLLQTRYTRDAVFVTNDVHDLRVDTTVFVFEQYPAVVDGCRFEGLNFRSWVQDHRFDPIDVNGEPLSEPALFNEMTLRDIDPDIAVKPVPAAEAAKVPKGGSIEVTTVDEFLSAIGPDRTIILDGELFDLSTASNYGAGAGEYYYWHESHDGPELVIDGASGLSIRPKEAAAGETTIAAIPRYANVLNFRNCDDLVLVNLTVGHTEEPGACSGGVLDFQNCSNISVGGCRLYGCGILGISASACTTVKVKDTEIFECSQGAASFYRTDGIFFQNCDVHDVPSPAFIFRECGDKTWNDEPISGLESYYDVGEDGSLAPLELRQEEPEYHGTVEDLVNPFAEETPLPMEAGSPMANFAAAVQMGFAERDWESLADKIAFPIQFFVEGYSFVIHDRAEFLDMVPQSDFEGVLFSEEYCERMAKADTSEYGSTIFGNTILDHCIAVTCFGEEMTEDNLKIRAISTASPLWPGRSMDVAAPYVQVTPEPAG